MRKNKKNDVENWENKEDLKHILIGPNGIIWIILFFSYFLWPFLALLLRG